MAIETELHAFGQLVEAHYPAVAAVAFATTHDLALAEDIAQDTFIAAWSQRGQLRDPSRVRPWLCGIARNQCRNALRRRRREVGANDDQLTDPSPTALDRALDRETLSELRAALAAMPGAYRESLVLYYWEDRSIAQVASVLAISEEAAQKRISRGRALLRDGLAERIEQVGRRRRAGTVAAASVVALLLAPAGAAHAASNAIRRSVGGGLSRVPRALLKALVPAAVGGALVLAYTSRTEPPPPPACCATTSAVLAEHSQRLRQLANHVARVQFDNTARDEQIAELAAAPAASAAPAAPRPRKPPTRTATAAVQAVPPPAAAERKQAATPASACDWVECHLRNYPGECCQAIRATLKEVPSGIPGINKLEPKERCDTC